MLCCTNKLSKEADGSYLYSTAGEAAQMCQKARGEYIPHLISPPLTWHDCVQTLLVASNLCALIRKMMIPGSHQLCVKLTVKLFGPSINEAQQSLRPTWEALGKQYILQRKAQNDVDPGLGFIQRAGTAIVESKFVLKMKTRFSHKHPL